MRKQVERRYSTIMKERRRRKCMLEKDETDEILKILQMTLFNDED
jgi:hypothetical protein